MQAKPGAYTTRPEKVTQMSQLNQRCHACALVRAGTALTTTRNKSSSYGQCFVITHTTHGSDSEWSTDRSGRFRRNQGRIASSGFRIASSTPTGLICAVESGQLVRGFSQQIELPLLQILNQHGLSRFEAPRSDGATLPFFPILSLNPYKTSLYGELKPRRLQRKKCCFIYLHVYVYDVPGHLKEVRYYIFSILISSFFYHIHDANIQHKHRRMRI
jgi:hypothetical protein